LRDAYAYLSKLALHDIKLSYVRYIGDSQYGLADAATDQYLSDMRELAYHCANLLLEGHRPPYYNFENRILHLWQGTRRTRFCPAGITRFGVSPSGGIYPCGPAAAMEDWRLGTVEDGLDRQATMAWRQEASFEQRQACHTCWARYLCAGGCPLQLVRNWDEEHCLINQHATRLAIAIYATVKGRNEMMLGALVDEGLVRHLTSLVQQEL
jgi:radical SAM protein with 4Fe4S-binding SPASM domain